MSSVRFVVPSLDTVSDRESFLGPRSDVRWNLLPREEIRLSGTVLREISLPGDNPDYLTFFNASAYTAQPCSYDRISNVIFYPSAGSFVRLSDENFHKTTIVGTWSNASMSGVTGVQNGPEGLTNTTVSIIDKITTIIDTPCIICSHSAYGNYGHFILDCLSAIIPFKDRIVCGDLKLCTAPFMFQWQRDLIGLLGFRPEMIIEVRGEVLIRDAILPSMLSSAGLRFPNRITSKVFRELRVGAAPYQPINSEGRLRLFLNRNNKRKLRQEPQIRERLIAELGFISISPDHISVKEQIKLFEQAEIVVSTYGAALTNIGFCDPRTKVLEIRQDNGPDPWTLHCCALLGHEFACVTGSVSQDSIQWGAIGDRRYAVEYEIDTNVDTVFNSVREMLYQ